MKISNFARGFTVVELTVYMGLLTILLMILTEVFSSVINVQLESETVSSVEQDARFIFSSLTYNIINAQSITTPANLGDQTLILEFTRNNINYTYNVQNGNLTINDNIGTDQLNSFNTTIGNVRFTRLGESGGKPTVQIEFSVTGKTIQTKGQETKSIQTTVGLR
ncbi:MAG: hypothetical protein HY429_03005 [Candidatus Levybacteria bacterium]|nr:hypothetical protein [Candidatus Levybacteria bacterium]